jgi:hypothetical protein
MNKLNLILILLLLLGATLGCLGPGSADSRCRGTIDFEGNKYVGSAKDEKQAELNACNKFCLEHDSEFETMYQIWLDSSDGKAYAESIKRKPTKFEATMENKRLLDYVTKNCANRCVKEANKGKHKLEVNCKK